MDHGPHSRECATAEGGECHCQCHGRQHGIAHTPHARRPGATHSNDVTITREGSHYRVTGSNGLPPGGGTREERVRARAERVSTASASREASRPAGAGRSERMRAWQADAARLGVREETVRTRRQARLEDFERDLADARRNLAEADEAAQAEARRQRLTGRRRAEFIDTATRSQANDVRWNENQLEGVRTSRDPVWDEPVETRRVGAQDVDPDRPLAVYGDLLNIADDSAVTSTNLHELEEVPAHIHGAVRDHLVRQGRNAGIYTGNAMVPELDDLGHLRGTSPRGWPPGSTWDDVPGVVAEGRIIAIGDGRHSGASSTARHELGHGADEAIGARLGVGKMSARPDWLSLHGDYVAEPGPHNPYYLQPGRAGAQEMWAEAFSAWAHGRRRGGPAAAQQEIAAHFRMSPGLAQRYVDYFESVDRSVRGR